MVIFVCKQSKCDITKQLAYNQVLMNAGYRLPHIACEKRTYEQQRAAMYRIGDEWKESEKKRKLKEMEIQEATKCKAVDSISGVYEYFDTDSFSKIDACEYVHIQSN